MQSRTEQICMYPLILVVDIIERQIRRYKTKLMNQKLTGTEFKKEFFEVEDDTPDEEIKIIRSKKFAIKPMDVEEACVQMELIGHTFFVFRNADTFEVMLCIRERRNFRSDRTGILKVFEMTEAEKAV